MHALKSMYMATESIASRIYGSANTHRHSHARMHVHVCVNSNHGSVNSRKSFRSQKEPERLSRRLYSYLLEVRGRLRIISHEGRQGSKAKSVFSINLTVCSAQFNSCM